MATTPDGKGSQIYDVAVVGLGCFGAAATRHLAKEEGLDIIAIGADEPNLDILSPADAVELSSDRQIFGEHYDQGRVARMTSPERTFERIGRASIQRYHDVQKQSGIDFYREVGCLTIASSADNPSLDDMMTFDERGNTTGVVRLGAEGLKKTFPYLQFAEGACGIYEPTGSGYITPRGQIKSHLHLAQQASSSKVSMMRDIVTRITEDYTEDGKEPILALETEAHGHVRARKVLLAAGGFTNFGSLLLASQKADLLLVSHTVVLGEIREEEAERLHDMPCLVYLEGQFEYILPPVQYPNGKYYIKAGHDASLDGELADHEAVSAWYREGRGDAKTAEFLRENLQALLPSVNFIDWTSRACVISKTPTHYPYVGMVTKTLGLVTGGNGNGAKGADEWGRLASEMMLKGKLTDEKDREKFQPRFVDKS